MADLNFTIGLSADGLIQGAAQAQRALDGMDKRAQALGRQMQQQQILMEQGADALRLYKIASANVSESDKKRLLQMELATQAAAKERAAQQERAAGVAQLQAAWAREEAAQNAKKQAIDKSIAAMQKEAAVLGKTAAAQKLYELQVQGATQAQLKQAAALQAQIAARQRLSQGVGIGGNLGGAALAAVGIGGTAGILKAADEWTVFQNRLKLVTATAAELKEAQEGILAVAKRTGQDLGGTAEVYQRMAANQKELGLNGKELLQITETINKSIVVGGSTAQGASAALTQFGQAMASGVLRGEEFNSMMEQAPGLARALADGLGVGVGQLRNMANNGELTAERVTQALLKAGVNVDAQFKKMDLTIAQSATNFKTSLTEFIGKSNEASGAAKVLSGAIQFAAEHVDVLAAGVAALVALSVGKWAIMTTANVLTYAAALAVAHRQGAATAVSQTATAAAIGRTGAAAQLAALNVGTFGGSLKALQLAGSAASGALNSFVAAHGKLLAIGAAAIAATTALTSLYDILNGGDGKNWASSGFDWILDKLGLIDSRVETLGTKLAEINEKPFSLGEKIATATGPFGALVVQGLRWRESLTDGAKQLERAAAVAKTIQLQTGYTAAIGKVEAAGGAAAFKAGGLKLDELRKSIDETAIKYREQAEQIGKTSIELEKMRLEAQKQAALKKEEAEAQKLYKDLPNAAQLVAEQLKNSAAQYDKSIASVVENMTLTERATRERTAAEKAQTAALERARAVTESLQGLRDNLARVGKTAQEIKLMDLADKGATAAQLAEAKALLEATAAKEKAYEAAQAKLSDAGGTMLKAAETMKGVAEQWNGEPDLLKGGSYIQQQWAAEKAKIDAANAAWEAQYGKARSLASMVAESRQNGNGDNFAKLEAANETALKAAQEQVRAADVFEAAANKVADAAAKPNSANTAAQSLPQVQQPQEMGRVTLDMRFPDGKALTGVLFGEQAFIKQLKEATYKNIDGYIKDMHTALA